MNVACKAWQDADISYQLAIQNGQNESDAWLGLVEASKGIDDVVREYPNATAEALRQILIAK